MDGLDVKVGELRMAKGSAEAGALEGAANADCMDKGGCGVLEDDPEGAEPNAEKALNPGGGVEVDDDGPRAVLFCVIDDKSAGPGMSVRFCVSLSSQAPMRSGQTRKTY